MVECPLMMRLIVGSFLHNGPIELFRFRADVIKAVVCTVLIISFVANGWSSPHNDDSGIPDLCGP